MLRALAATAVEAAMVESISRHRLGFISLRENRPECRYAVAVMSSTAVNARLSVRLTSQIEDRAGLAEKSTSKAVFRSELAR